MCTRCACPYALAISRSHSFSLYRRCVVRKYQHRISGSTLVINHILYDMDTLQYHRWQHSIDLAFILIITMMMVLMMWPLCILRSHIAHTVHCFSFVGLSVLAPVPAVDCKPTNIVKHWCKQGNKRFTAAVSYWCWRCCCCCLSQFHISIRMVRANRSYTVINFNLMKSSYFIPSKMEIWFSPVSSCSSLLRSLFLFVALSITFHSLIHATTLFMRWIVRLYYGSTDALSTQRTNNFISSYFPSNRKQNTHSQTVHTGYVPHSRQSYTDKMTNNEKSTHWFKYDQMLVLKLCR